MKLSHVFAILSIAMLGLPGSGMAQKNDRAPPAVQAEFNAFIGKFRAAVKANDAGAVTAMTRFPFLHFSDLRDEAAFRKQVYPKLFTARVRDCLQRGRGAYGLDGEGSHNFSLFCGETIFLMAKRKNDTGFLFAETGVND